MSASPGASDSTVSWQTAFWAVFSTAGNTFVQDPGIVLNDAKLPGRTIRISPIFCLLDAVWILWHFFTTWRRESDGPAAAADMVLRERKIEARNLWQGQWYIWFLPGFYAFVQLVKLTGMQGVPFTMICAWCYFVGYLVLETLKVVAGRYRYDGGETTEEPQTDLEVPPGQPVAFFCGFLLQIALIIALMADFPDKLTEGIDRDKDFTFLDEDGKLRSSYPGWYCRPLQYVQIFQAVLVSLTNGFSGSRDGFFTAFLHHSLSVLQATFPLWSITLNRWGILASWIASLLYAWFHSGVLFLLIVGMVSESGDEQRFRKLGIHWHYQFQAIVFVMLSFIHYVVIYDPEGTFKPEWTEALG